MPSQQEDSRTLDRSARAREVIDTYLRNRGNDEPIPHERIMTEHSGLLPELSYELRKLHLIERARTTADARSSSDPHEESDRTGSSLAKDGFGLHSFPGYEVSRRLHRGGQGIVYLAMQTATRREVAIKVMREGLFASPHDRMRFEREVHVLGSLSHPHIVTIHDSGSVGGQFYYVMDYIPGDPLDVSLSREKRSVKEKLRVLAKVCHAVNAAHLKGIIHRDLKPSNILVDQASEPCVLDFGLAKIETDEKGSQHITATGQFVGSLPWAAPEQVDSTPGQIDIRTDVYSLGVILYQVLTSRFPYSVVGHVREVMDNISTTQPLRPSAITTEIDDEVETIVLKCLHKEPERRYQSAGDLARDIDRYLSGEPIEAKRDSTWYVLKKNVQRFKIPLIGGVAFLALLTGFSIAISIMYGRASREARTANRVQACLESLFSQLGTVEGAYKLTVREILDQGAERVTKELADVPDAQARLMETLARRYSSLGLYRDAVHWLGRSITIRQQVLKSPAYIVADKLHDLGEHYCQAGQVEKARDVFDESLVLRQSVSDARSAKAAATLCALARVYHLQGSYAEAKQRYQESLKILRSLHEGAHPDTLATLLAYSAFLDNEGKYDDAEKMAETAVTMARYLYKKDHENLRDALRTHAVVLHSKGRYESALLLAHDALEMSRRLNATHIGRAADLELVGLLLKDKGAFAEAEPYLLDSLNRVTRRSGGEDIRAIAYAQHSLAKLYVDAREWEKAKHACRKSLDGYSLVLPADHFILPTPLTLLGQILVQQRRYVEAETLLSEAFEIRKKRKPQGHWETAKTESILGSALTGQGRFEEAESLLLHSYPLIVADRGAEHRRTNEAIQRIVTLYEVWGKSEEANKWRTTSRTQ